MDCFRVTSPRKACKLSREAENQIREALLAVSDRRSDLAAFWEQASGNSAGSPHAAEALRAMHSSGLLVRLVPGVCAPSIRW